MDSLISPQGIENLIIMCVGSFSAGVLLRISQDIHTLSVIARLSLNPSASRPTVPVSKKEIERMIDPNEAGRYAKFNIPNSLKAWKESV